MCGAPTTSREHVPPLCLFPEEKDIGTKAFRKNLITVPSCELHNSKKSKDDEFLMVMLAGFIGNNFLGFLHTQTKIMRAFDRNNNLADAFLKNAIPTMVKGKNGKEAPVLRGTLDNNLRLTKCFEHIGYGLYYHEFGKRFEGQLYCMIDFVTYLNKTAETWKLVSRKTFDLAQNQNKVVGNAPQVFKYQKTNPNEDGVFGIRLTFYEGAMVFISYHPPNVVYSEEPISKKIKSGETFTVRLQDGTKYEIGKFFEDI
jgi:hypothetical protein